MKTALAIGAAAVGLYAFYRLVQTLRPAPVAAAPPPSAQPSATRTLDKYAGLVLEKAIDALSFDGKSWADSNDAETLKYLMCNCYKQGEAGNDNTRPESNPCQSVQQMAPGLKCRGGNCDCSPTFVGNVATYRFDGQTYSTPFRSKDFATKFITGNPNAATPVGTAPAGGRVAPSAPGQVFAGPVRAAGAVGGGSWRAQ